MFDADHFGVFSPFFFFFCVLLLCVFVSFCRGLWFELSLFKFSRIRKNDISANVLSHLRLGLQRSGRSLGPTEVPRYLGSPFESIDLIKRQRHNCDYRFLKKRSMK